MSDAQLTVDVLYEDEALVVVDKPGGILCHRTRESSDRVFLLQTVGRQLGAHLYPIHRLDRATSGAIVFARSSSDARRLQESLTGPGARKEYLTLVRGSTPELWESTRPLSKTKGNRQPAHTSFEKIAEFSRCSLLRARLHTGRRNQIRRHLAHAAHQVLGDTSYGKGRINQYFREHYGLPRLFLHAHRLEIDHPRTDERVTFVAPLATDLREFLLRLPDVEPDLLIANGL